MGNETSILNLVWGYSLKEEVLILPSSQSLVNWLLSKLNHGWKLTYCLFFNSVWLLALSLIDQEPFCKPKLLLSLSSFFLLLRRIWNEFSVRAGKLKYKYLYVSNTFAPVARFMWFHTLGELGAKCSKMFKEKQILNHKETRYINLICICIFELNYS